MRILKDYKYEIWYMWDNKTVYIYPPISVYAFKEIKKALSYYNLDIKNIVVGKRYEMYW